MSGILNEFPDSCVLVRILVIMWYAASLLEPFVVRMVENGVMGFGVGM